MGEGYQGWTQLGDDIRDDDLLSSLNDCLQRELGGEVAVLFSGGLDSAVLARLARDHCRPVLYTIGYPGAHDLHAGRNAAEELSLPWQGLELDDGRLREGLAALRDLSGLTDPVSLSFELPLYLGCTMLREDILLSGQGADELFGGYARYRSMDDAQRASAMGIDLGLLISVGRPREARLAEASGKRLVCPYLDPGVIKAAGRFSASEMVGEAGNKLPLRRLARNLGLSSASAPKKAAQYGSGIMAAMKRLASGDGMGLSEWVREVEG